MRRRLLTLLLVAVAAFVASRAVGEAPSVGDPFGTTVVRVVDGDTVVVQDGPEETTVRLVQIDAPESSASRYGRPDRCGAAATRFARRLVRPGDTVTVESAGSDDTDRYGRVLAYVRLGGEDDETWQEAIVRAGWAEPLVVGGNETPLLGRLEALADEAQAAGRGVWGRCGGDFHSAAP